MRLKRLCEKSKIQKNRGIKNHSSRTKNSLQVKYGPKVFCKNLWAEFSHSLFSRVEFQFLPKVHSSNRWPKLKDVAQVKRGWYWLWRWRQPSLAISHEAIRERGLHKPNSPIARSTTARSTTAKYSLTYAPS